MIDEMILAGMLAQYKQTNNWRDNINPIIDLKTASWWSVNIYCADYCPTIGPSIKVPPILPRSSAVSFNSANPTWDVSWVVQRVTEYFRSPDRAAAHIAQNIAGTCQKYFQYFITTEILSQNFSQIFQNILSQHCNFNFLKYFWKQINI